MTSPEFDWQILYFIQDHMKCSFFDATMPFVSLISELGAVWLIAAAVLCFTKKYRKQGVLIMAVIAAAAVIGSGILKPLIARPRPCWLDTGIPLLIQSPTDFSFPSGHASSSFAAAFLLAKTNKKFGYAAVPFAVLVAFSRLYLFVHFPSDIAAGILLGTFLAAMIWKYGMPFLERHEDFLKTDNVRKIGT